MLGMIATAMLASPIAIIPKPVSMQTADGFFSISPKTVIVAAKSEEPLAIHIRDWLKPALGYSLEVRSRKTLDAIEISLDRRLVDLGPEGYTLFVVGEGVHIRAFGDQLFHNSRSPGPRCNHHWSFSRHQSQIGIRSGFQKTANHRLAAVLTCRP